MADNERTYGRDRLISALVCFLSVFLFLCIIPPVMSRADETGGEIKSGWEFSEVAKDMAASGITAVELCAGFGFEGTAMIKQAIPGIPVGSVKFDFHPAFGFKTGDDVFK